MKKKILSVVFVVIIILTGCSVKISEDTYEVLDVFNQSRTLLFERVENNKKAELVYDIEIDGDLVKTDVAIRFPDGEYKSKSTFNSKDLIPVYAAKSNSYRLDPKKNWLIEGEYGDELSMTANTEKGVDAKTVKLPQRYVDNESLLISLSSLKYEEGYSKNINVSIIDAAEIVTFNVSYKGIETIEVPYGKIECIKVALKYDGLVLGPKPLMYFWYSNDEKRIPIMSENSGVFLKLKSVSKN